MFPDHSSPPTRRKKFEMGDTHENDDISFSNDNRDEYSSIDERNSERGLLQSDEDVWNADAVDPSIPGRWSCNFMCLDQNGQPINDIDTIINNGVKIFSDKFTPWRKRNVESCLEMGSILSRCKKIEEITINFAPELDEEMIRAIFRSCNGPYVFPLTRLDLGHNELGPGEIYELIPFLQCLFGVLEFLGLHYSRIGNRGCEMISEVLEDLDVLDLNMSCAQITTGGMAYILASQEDPCLETLDFSGNEIGRVDFDYLALFLSQNDVLEYISIGGTNQHVWEFEWMRTLLRSIDTNTTLKELQICGFVLSQRDDEDLQAYDQLTAALQALFFDTTSLEAFLGSNHVLSLLFCNSPYQPPQPVLRAMTINSSPNVSTNKKIRLKMQSIYFRQDFDTQPFNNMKLAWMPSVLELGAMSDENLSVYCAEKQGRENIDCIFQKGNLNGIFKFIRYYWNGQDFLHSNFTSQALKDGRTNNSSITMRLT